MKKYINNQKLLNKSELARLYKKIYGEKISSQYVRALLNPNNKRKNLEKLDRLKNIIKQL